MVQTLIVLGVVLLAVAYIGGRVLRTARSARAGARDGCGGDCCGGQ